MNLINTTPNGQIFACPCIRKIHLEFGNLLLSLSYDEFSEFTDYVNSIDYKYYLIKNRKAENRRKLLLHIGKKDIHLALFPCEFIELRKLLLIPTRPEEYTDNQAIIGNTILN